MSLKLTAGVAVVLCGWLIGVEGRQRLLTRARSLAWFRVLFLDMRSMISHSGMSLSDIIYDMRQRNEGNLFLSLLQENLCQLPFREAWNVSVERQRSALCLRQEDERLLTDCAAMLGKSDVEGELNAFTLIDERLSRAAEEADVKLRTDGKIYVAVGGAGGMIAALLLL